MFTLRFPDFRWISKHGWLSFCYIHNVSLCRSGLLLSTERDGQRLPLALWKLSCYCTPIGSLSPKQGARRLVFPAQSGSKRWCWLWPTAFPLLSLATVPTLPVASSLKRRGRLVLGVLRYGHLKVSATTQTDIQRQCFCQRDGSNSLFILREDKKHLCVFSTTPSSKAAERSLTWFHMKHSLSHQQLFSFPTQAWLEGCRLGVASGRNLFLWHDILYKVFALWCLEKLFPLSSLFVNSVQVSVLNGTSFRLRGCFSSCQTSHLCDVTMVLINTPASLYILLACPGWHWNMVCFLTKWHDGHYKVQSV